MGQIMLPRVLNTLRSAYAEIHEMRAEEAAPKQTKPRLRLLGLNTRFH